MSEKTKLTEGEIEIIKELGDPLYTPNFIEDFINDKSTVMINPVNALQAMGCHGYLRAVQNLLHARGKT